MTEYVPEQYPRRFIPATVDLTTWETIEPWYTSLLDRPIQSAAELESWLADAGELGCVVSQLGTKRYIAMTSQTDDPAREAAHLEFVREIEPKQKPCLQALREKYLDCPFREELPPTRYGVYSRAERNRQSLYRAANVPRETQLAELEQQYQKTIGAMVVSFRGTDYTPAQMARFLEETDRATRQEAWELVTRRRLAEKENLESLFDKMRGLRQAIAREAGFNSFVEYAYRKRERYDYGRAHAEAFHKAVENLVVPLATRRLEHRRSLLGIPALRPWDLAVDPRGRPPLRPFTDADRLGAGAESILRRVNTDLGAQFAYLKSHGLLDLANRKGKAPGGYQTTLEDDRLPFIFMNAVGVDGDLRTILHEAGHAFHSLASRGQFLAAYRDSPIEFCEVASMSMELLAAPELGEFYNDADARRSYQQLLEGIVLILPWIATVDALQHWVYDHPDHARSDRCEAWAALVARFGGQVDWRGHEEARDHVWHRQLHIFLYPFYYIEYGIAQLGALGIWKASRADRPGAIAAYRRALALGGSRPLPDLFETAGLPFDFSEKTIGPLIEEVESELARLD